MNYDEKFWREVTDYCIENYIRIDGKVYFGIWNLGNMIKSFGSAEKFGEMINDFGKRAREKGVNVDIVEPDELYGEGYLEALKKVFG